ncbi:MCE family protein [Gordonia sp. NPDC058843]|uniref:MCE family protein n=1 Tax=Gordonia sp. NPDC058843 TaxID=3346648 RepID=UPI00368A5A5B
MTVALTMVVAAVSFNGGFIRSEEITIVAKRSGLLMKPGSKVTYRGVEVGRVGTVKNDDRTARLAVNIDSDVLSEIPANARIEITSTTVFGSKYVNIVAPEQPSTASMAAGDVISTEDVTVEINTVFQNLSDVLRQIQPEKLNETLGALAAALGDGRGAGLGAAIDQIDTLLQRVNSPRAGLGPTLDAAADALLAYAPNAPELMAIASRVRTTATTITDKAPQIDVMLTNIMGLSAVGTDVLQTNKEPLISAFDLLSPTTTLMRVYAPSFTCTIKGMDNLLEKGLPALGSAKYPGIHLDIGFLPGVPFYGYPGNLPVVGASGGPRCFGLPNVPPGASAPYLVTDTGVNPYRGEPSSLRVLPQDLLTSLVGRPVRSGR